MSLFKQTICYLAVLGIFIQIAKAAPLTDREIDALLMELIKNRSTNVGAPAAPTPSLLSRMWTATKTKIGNGLAKIQTWKQENQPQISAGLGIGGRLLGFYLMTDILMLGSQGFTGLIKLPKVLRPGLDDSIVHPRSVIGALNFCRETALSQEHFFGKDKQEHYYFIPIWFLKFGVWLVASSLYLYYQGPRLQDNFKTFKK